MAQEQQKRGGVAPMSAVLAQLLREHRITGSRQDEQVLAAWRAVCGPRLAQRSRPLRFREGELIVEVTSAAHLQELENFKGEGLRRAANRELGEERIRRIQFQPKR